MSNKNKAENNNMCASDFMFEKKYVGRWQVKIFF